MEFLFLEKIRKYFIGFIVLLLVFHCGRLNAQNELKIDGGGNPVLGRIAYGLIFFPKTSQDDKPDSTLKYCTVWTRIYYIEGLKLSETRFVEVGIKYKDVIKKKSTEGADEFKNAVYTYKYKNSDTTSCIETLNFFIHVHLPIRLNGKELKAEEREEILKGIPPEKLLQIKRKKPLLGKGVIEITTAR